jgi:hypothetical protein
MTRQLRVISFLAARLEHQQLGYRSSATDDSHELHRGSVPPYQKGLSRPSISVRRSLGHFEDLDTHLRVAI